MCRVGQVRDSGRRPTDFTLWRNRWAGAACQPLVPPYRHDRLRTHGGDVYWVPKQGSLKMRLIQQRLLFSTPEGVAMEAQQGFRLHRIEVFNWGTFDSSNGQVYSATK